MRLTPLAWIVPALAISVCTMQAAPAFAQAAAPTTGPTNAPATTPPMTAPSPANNGLPPATMAAPTASAPTATAPTATAPTHAHRMSLADRFKAANTSNDGNLTLEQAKAANWSYVANHFSAIDKTSKGSVTLADIQAFAKARRAARHRATTHAAPASSAAPSSSANPPAAINPPPMTP